MPIMSIVGRKVTHPTNPLHPQPCKFSSSEGSGRWPPNAALLIIWWVYELFRVCKDPFVHSIDDAELFVERLQ